MKEDIDGRANEPFFSGEVGPDDRGTESEDWSGHQLVHYRIRRELGHGSMGVVYLAEDMRLRRLVAIKSLTARLRKYPDAIEQIKHEAQLLAQLNHSGVSIIYDILEHDGDTYLILEYVPGRTLAESIADGPHMPYDILSIAIQIADAVSAAHAVEIVHRDLKPPNIKITDDGTVKVLDFGIGITPERCARTQLSAGTPAYMSPEQVRGEAADGQSDIWAIGCILYEMLTAGHPFARATREETFSSILENEPDWSALPAGTPPELYRITAACLAKDKDARYPTAQALVADLRQCHELLTHSAVNTRVFWRRLRQPKTATALICTFVVAAAGVGYLLYRANRVDWAHTQALPTISQLIEQQNYCEAFHLALKAKAWIGDDPLLQRLWPKMAANEFKVRTNPTGANVFYREYSDVVAPWRSLGPSPVDAKWFPFGFYKLRLEKDGYAPVEQLLWSIDGLINYHYFPQEILLHRQEQIPSEMVYVPRLLVPGADWWLASGRDTWSGPFFMDRYEVSNRDYSDFVKNGGYEDQRFWEHGFAREGREIPWQEAMTLFRDGTGQPGPKFWHDGIYPAGQDDYPVTGISWYEAAAYAKYKDKSLPTVYHWIAAAMPLHTSTYATVQSNFNTGAVWPVGGQEAMNVFGCYDMAGNVAEWCYNSRNDSHDERYVLGGAWDELDFMFYVPACKDAFTRPANTGFRCIRCLPDAEPAKPWEFLAAPTNVRQRNLYAAKPLPERDFRLLTRALFAYDHEAPLNVEDADAEVISPSCRMERVTIDAAYNGERMDVLLYLPTEDRFVPPYQTVVVFPTGSAMGRRSSRDIPEDWLEPYLVDSGRAVVIPVYKGMWERGPLPYPWNWTVTSLPVFEWVKDWMRTADYLKTRNDIDSQKTAFFGYSLGGVAGLFISGAEPPIFQACILRAGGIPIYEEPPPERDPVNYAPYIKIPILMVNGRNDWLLPMDASTKPLLDLLGTPPADKHHVVIYEGEHGVPEERLETEIIGFLDRYFGPPAGAAP